MKKKLSLLSCGLFTSFSVLAGQMGPISTDEQHTTYVAITGGNYSSLYQANYTESTNGITTTRESFNDTNNNGFGQIAIGTAARFGTFKFDQQVVASVLGGNLTFNTLTSQYTFKQQVDFGYDIMPNLNVNLIPKLDAYGILGVHYGHFMYKKTSSFATSETFNVSRNQVGFDLGVGLGYAINDTLSLGLKYQYLQYSSTNVYGTNSTVTANEIEQIPPSFNLVGLELRYYIN